RTIGRRTDVGIVEPALSTGALDRGEIVVPSLAGRRVVELEALELDRSPNLGLRETVRAQLERGARDLLLLRREPAAADRHDERNLVRRRGGGAHDQPR